MSKEVSVNVHVKPDASQPSGYDFWMDVGGTKKSTLSFDKTKDKMKKSEHYDVVFTLHNEDGADLVFSKLSNIVTWAAATDGPTGACPPANSNFPGWSVDPDTPITDYSLSVINTDDTEQYFSFCLNFVPKGTIEGPNTIYIPYDPIGDNKDGGSSSHFSSAAVIAAIVAAVVIVFAAYEFGLFAR